MTRTPNGRVIFYGATAGAGRPDTTGYSSYRLTLRSGDIPERWPRRGCCGWAITLSW
jgi:hypothetical protein